MNIWPCINQDCSRFFCKSVSLCGALFFALAAPGSRAQPLGDTTLELGISALHFSYAEYDDAGALLDKELGNVPGLSLRLAHRSGNWEGEALASYHYGRVDYNGLTTLGAQLSTSTDEALGDVAVRLGYRLQDIALQPYAGVGYRRWDRNILSAGNVSGLFESYRWGYGWLGAKYFFYQQEASDLLLDLGWIKPINPSMSADVYHVNLDLGSSDALRLMLTARLAFAGNIAFVLEPYAEYWRLGRSAAVNTYQGCLPAPPCSVYEPTSDTRNIGMNLRLGVMF